MSFRLRLTITFLLAVLVPLIVLSLFIRNEMTHRLTSQYEHRVESLLEVIEDDLAKQGETITASIEMIKRTVLGDNRFRKAALDEDPVERRYLLDYAANTMQLAGLSMLQIQDEKGRIMSSGHFRNEYDRLEPELPKLLASNSKKSALVMARAPDEPFLALAQVDSVVMGKSKFMIVAGIKVGKLFLSRLAREDEVFIALFYPGGELSSIAMRDSVKAGRLSGAHGILRELRIPYVDAKRSELTEATFRVIHSLEELRTLQKSIDRWFILVVIASCLGAFLLVSWLSSRVSRPLVELAHKTSRIDLDRLDINFESKRKDEIGTLSRVLGSMTARLRASAAIAKDAERRATLGEIARQVNHDIKNGLTPIRNVFRHLVEQAGSNAKELAAVFEDRKSTIDSSISYLERLASNYARLSRSSGRELCDLNGIIGRIISDVRSSSEVNLHANLEDNPVISGDPLSIRRIFENLIDNAIDSLEGGKGEIVVASKLVRSEEGRRLVRLVVSDTGKGMNEEEKAKVFDDFYTTKENGTGLGLSIVRRLVVDLEGSIRVESEKGKGTRFIIDLPEENQGGRGK